jgi:hypothetical protein
MNYTYKLEEDEYGGTIIIEYIEEYKNQKWFLSDFLELLSFKPPMENYLRIERWLQENHPELLI